MRISLTSYTPFIWTQDTAVSSRLGGQDVPPCGACSWVSQAHPVGLLPAIAPPTLDDYIRILSINDCRFSIEQRASNRQSKIDNRKSEKYTLARRGQSVVEYAVLVVAVAAALVGMYGYLRSSLAHRMKGGADGIGHGLLYYDTP